MSRICTLLFENDSLPIETFIARARLWSFLDLILCAAYAVRYRKQSLEDSDHGALPAVTVILSVLFGIDGLVLIYLTQPKRVFTFPRWTFPLNTAMNFITLCVNIAYLALEAKYSLVVYQALACLVICNKTLRCWVLHKLAVRIRAHIDDGMAEKSGDYIRFDGNALIV
jgi:hypothetical protein